MAIEKVKAYFAQFGMEVRVMEAATHPGAGAVQQFLRMGGCVQGALEG